MYGRCPLHTGKHVAFRAARRRGGGKPVVPTAHTAEGFGAVVREGASGGDGGGGEHNIYCATVAKRSYA